MTFATFSFYRKKLLVLPQIENHCVKLTQSYRAELIVEILIHIHNSQHCEWCVAHTVENLCEPEDILHQMIVIISFYLIHANPCLVVTNTAHDRYYYLQNKFRLLYIVYDCLYFTDILKTAHLCTERYMD